MADPAAIQPASVSEHLRIALNGGPGIGKSRVVGTSAKLGPTLVIRPPTDHLDALLPEDRAVVKEWIVRDWDDLGQVEEYLRAEGGKWEWVWLDSLSLAQDHLLDDELETEIAMSRNPDRGKYGPDKPVYGRNFYKIASFLRNVIGPDTFNFGWTSHPERLKSPDQDDEGDPIEKLMPWVQGRNMSPKCCGYMNMVLYMSRSKTGRRRLFGQSTDVFYAKDQFDAIPAEGLWDPTMPKLLELIAQARGSAPPKPAKRTAKRRPVLKGR